MIDYKREKISNIIKAMTLEEKEVVAAALPKNILENELSRRENLIISRIERVRDICFTVTPESTIEELESALRATRKLLT